MRVGAPGDPMIREALRNWPSSASSRPASAAAGTSVGASFTGFARQKLWRCRGRTSSGGERTRREQHRALAAIACLVERALLRSRNARAPVQSPVAQRNSSTAVADQPSEGECARPPPHTRARSRGRRGAAPRCKGHAGQAPWCRGGSPWCERCVRRLRDRLQAVPIAALNKSASGSPGAMRLASLVNLRAAVRSPEPTAMSLARSPHRRARPGDCANGSPA